MNIAFGGQLTQQDYLDAQYVHQGMTRAERVIQVIVVVGLVLILPIAFLLAPDFLLIALPAVLLCLFASTMNWWLPRIQIPRIWRNQKGLQAPIEGVASEEGIQYNSVHFKNDLSWSLFLMYKLSPTLMLLYQSPKAFNMVPKHMFQNDADWQSFVSIVARNVADGVKVDQQRRQRVQVVFFVMLLIGVVIGFSIISYLRVDS